MIANGTVIETQPLVPIANGTTIGTTDFIAIGANC